MRKVAKKLTDAAVIDIMTDKVSTPKELAARHNVATTQIYDIHKGKTWKHISLDPKYIPRNFKQERRKLNPVIVADIKSGKVTDLHTVAKQYNVNRKYLVSLLNQNRYECWKTIPINPEVKVMRCRKNLTKQEVIDILSDKTSRIIDICKKFNINHKTVYKLRAGLTHKDITLDPKYKWDKPMFRRLNNKTKKFTDQEVIDIITDHTTDVNVLAERHGVDKRCIQNLYGGRTYKYITRKPEYYNTRRVFTSRVLNEEIVRAIKNNERTDFEAIAQEYGVSVKYLRQLRNPNNFDTWKFIPTPSENARKVFTRKPLTEEEVIGIISHVKEQVKVIARKYNVHPKTVSNLRIGRLKKHITLDLSLNKWLEARKNGTGRSNQNGDTEKCYAHSTI